MPRPEPVVEEWPSPDGRSPFPKAETVALGLASGSTAAALPVLLMGPLGLIVLPIAFIIAAAHALLIALPAYLLLRNWIELNYRNSIIAGFATGSMPVTLMSLYEYNQLGSGAGAEIYTLPWFISSLPAVALPFGLLGAIGGGVFGKVTGKRAAVGAAYSATSGWTR